MRVCQAAITVALFLMLFIPVSAAAAAGGGEIAPALTLPANDTSLSAASHGPGAPLSAFEKQDEITLLRLEWNRTTFPGPRSMAYGPRYIAVALPPGLLVVLVAVIGIAAGGYIVYKRRRAEKMAGPGNGTGGEKEG